MLFVYHIIPDHSDSNMVPPYFQKTVIKSAEYLTATGATGPSQLPNTNTHSRSVSHDSYFDTTVDHPSCSSLIDTQHEGILFNQSTVELRIKRIYILCYTVHEDICLTLPQPGDTPINVAKINMSLSQI